MVAYYPISLKDIENKVEEVIAELLKETIESLDLDNSFLELGINSVLAVELVNTVNQRLGTELGIEVVFDYRGIKELAEHIFDQYGEKVPTHELEKTNVLTGQIKIPRNFKERIATNSKFNNHNAKILQRLISDIAIIGMSGKIASAETIEEFWDYLLAGNSCISEIRRKGWNESEYYDPNPERKNKSISKWGGLLKDYDKFDPLFFNISPMEAERMDPQQRLFLEEAFKAFENGGYSIDQLSGKKVGVFVGGRSSDYKEKTIMKDEMDSRIFLGNEMSILAARISYFFNLKGPSIAVDTACSSSLVAINLACESIRRGESEIALSGGVFILSSPDYYVMASKTNMLSPDGKCKIFDSNADGNVIGEGVGVLILKSLDHAIKDRDYIYGVIKGSSINQDGRTMGITAPSMISQKALIYEAYKKSAIHPETISYIEAHGMGTQIGDPIEIKALTEAFRMFTDKKQFCAVGSHKANFGHTMLSAGVAGLFKILMAMKHRKIPPNINISKVNEHIELEGSPFFINVDLREWKSEGGKPLRAGISSFGLGGTNCHMILEEPPIQEYPTSKCVWPYYLFSLSAKSPTALKQKISDMANWLTKEADYNLAENVAYTLWVGRSHFQYRCVFIAKDLSELKQRILEVQTIGSTSNYLCNVEKGFLKTDMQYNEIKRYGERIICELNEINDSDPDSFVEKVFFLSDLYVKGYNLRWDNLFKNGEFRKIPLPTYPFNGESYWIPGNDTGKSISCHSYFSHPLLHQNTSDFSQQRFTTTFTGQEFFLSDHVISGEKVLPGAAYLEMARMAVEAAAGALREGPGTIGLKNVVWARPLVAADEPVKVHIGLYLEDDGRIAYEIYSEPGEEDAGVIYCQGNAVLSTVAEIPTIDIKSLKNECKKSILTASQCYDAFKDMGIDYGPGHRGIEEVYVGSSQVLARLCLPASVIDTQDQYVLHPSLMDSALQASIGLMMSTVPESLTSLKLSLPFALEELEILGTCSKKMWAVIRYSPGCKAEDTAKKVDIDLCTQEGNICVRLKGFSSRVLERELIPHNKSLNAQLVGINMLRPLDTDSEGKNSGELLEIYAENIPSRIYNIRNSILNNAEYQHALVEPFFDFGSIVEQVQASLVQSAAQILMVETENIDVDSHLSEYGFDPIMLMELADKFNKKSEIIVSPKIFFNHPTIRNIGENVVREYQSVLKTEVNRDLVDNAKKSEHECGTSTQFSIQEYVIHILSKQLHLAKEHIMLNKNFLEYGIDSIMTVKLIRSLEKQLNFKITRREVYKYPTIKDLSAYLAQKIEHLGDGVTDESKDYELGTI